MGEAPRPRVLALMGSGETSPTMVTVHKALVARLGPADRQAVLLDTPYAFQENAADISQRSQAYFARSVGLKVDVVSDADLPEAQNPSARLGVAAIRSADWVFAGPGSPSYALRRWRGGPVADALRDRIAAGAGLTVIASAAAAAIGLAAIPVYEIYKVGADPHWLPGLDLLSVLGLPVAVIPHYDNAEGGTHDTRFCYLGERRLAVLERELPAQAAVLGVDEHTALVIDLVTQEAEVVGRGGMTVRKAGESAVFPSGSRLALPDLRILVRDGAAAQRLTRTALARPRQGTRTGPDGAGRADAPARPGRRRAGGRGRVAAHESGLGDGGTLTDRDLPDLTAEAEERFGTAERKRNGAGMVSAILDLEAAIEAWSTDTDENDNADRARAVLRGLIVRLGQAAEQGLAEPAGRLRPGVDPLIALRASLRRDGSYAAADAIRDALIALGVELHDSPDGTTWMISSS
jgi:cyanophycinase-like exopeptidase